MKLYPIEVTNSGNWGKFAVGRFGPPEWAWTSQVDTESKGPLLSHLGWAVSALWVLDLQTGEGALFTPPGSARADLNKHRIWVCPMFEPFLEWLYEQDLTDLSKLPALVELSDAPFGLYGHRRPGPDLS